MKSFNTLITTALHALFLLTFVCLSPSQITAKSAERVDFVFPKVSDNPKLRLVSLLSDPKAKEFEQFQAPNGKGFVKPTQIAFGPNEEIYALDGGIGRIYLMHNEQGKLVSTRKLPKADRSFPSPTEITVDKNGLLWLVDSRLKTVFVIEPSGKIIDSVMGDFVRPVGIEYHPGLDRILLSDLALKKIFTISATKSEEGFEIESSFSDKENLEGPSYIAVGPQGQIHICDALTGTICVYTKDFELTGKFGGFGDGPGFFSRPKGIAVDAKGLVYVTDALFDNTQIFDADGQLLLTFGYSGSGVGEFSQPSGVAIDASGLLYIADSFNRRFQIYRWEN